MLGPQERVLGEIIFNNGQCQVLTQSISCFELIVSDERKNEIAEYTLEIELPEEEADEESGAIYPYCGKDPVEWDTYAYDCLLQVENETQLLNPKEHLEHKNTPGSE